MDDDQMDMLVFKMCKLPIRFVVPATFFGCESEGVGSFPPI